MNLLQASAGLLLYPGGLAAGLAGLVGEAAAARLLGTSPAWGQAWRSAVTELRDGLRSPSLLVWAAVFLSLLASAQVVAPFSPISPENRNLLVAAAALTAISALRIASLNRESGESSNPGLVCFVQAAWLVAVAAPALATPDLRPQVLGAVLISYVLPVKILAGLLYLLCLPPLLEIVPERQPGLQDAPQTDANRFRPVRILLWLPLLGLFPSLFVPPPADDMLGILRFAFGLLVTLAVALALARILVRQGGWFERAYLWLLGGMVTITILVAITLSIVLS